MKATNAAYDVEPSNARINDILESAAEFEESQQIPSADGLTYENGYYVDCSALFIDIRGSSQLPNVHKRNVLGKIYRSYISECVAAINSDPNCSEVFIEGDCVSGVINTPYKNDINTAFETAGRLNSVINLLNWRLEAKGYQTISCGVGLAYGRALMLKAGYKGSAISDIVWMGNVVNHAAKLCHLGNKDGNLPIQVSSDIQANLKAEYQAFLQPVYVLGGVLRYQADVVNKHMDGWLTEQKAKRWQATMAQLLIPPFGGSPFPP